jgi:cell filamentation protein
MPDRKYCYPNSDVLKNKLNITDAKQLFEVEKELTFIRLQELKTKPIIGKFDFDHLKKIHRYIFQDVYEWAGQIRTVEIGKGNLFCTTPCIQSYADSVFGKYYSQCYSRKEDIHEFVKVFSENYGDLNALHPFREGNGRAQREFARLVCLKCGYVFDLACTTHAEMLNASRISFDKADNSFLQDIFEKAVIPQENYRGENSALSILTSDDMVIDVDNNINYDQNEYNEILNVSEYDAIYQEKIREMKE